MSEWTPTNIREQVLAAVEKHAKNREALANATDDTRFLADLGIASASLIDIVLVLEDEFSFQITDEELKRMVTVGSAVKMLEEKLRAAGR